MRAALFRVGIAPMGSAREPVGLENRGSCPMGSHPAPMGSVFAEPMCHCPHVNIGYKPLQAPPENLMISTSYTGKMKKWLVTVSG